MTFPIVIAAIWVVLSVLAHVQRAQLVRELSTCAAHGKVKDATAALRQMVRMPEPPLETFVSAAASPSREVAQQAQSSLTELLRRWRRQLRSNKNVGRVAVRLEELAATLAAHRDSFSTLDYPWLAKTTEEIVRLANSAPLENSPALAIHCESLFALTSTRVGTTPSDVIPVASTAIDRAPDSVFSPPSRFALQSLVPEEAAEAHVLEFDAPTSPHTPDNAPPDSPLRWSRPGLYDSSQIPSPRLFYRRHRGEVDVASPIHVSDSPNVRSETSELWESVDSRSLLERWLAASGAQKSQLERELRRRGFGGLRADLVQLALSDGSDGRVQLVHDLLDTPAVGAKAWLMLLADDDDAEVRLSAVSIMATSSDAELLEKAWQVALHDRDPRIAGLAARLRNRRDTALRH